MQELDIGCKYHIIAKLNKSKYGWEYKPSNVFAIAPKSTEDQLMFLCTLVNEKIANGDFNGKDYILTYADKIEIAKIIKDETFVDVSEVGQ